MTRPDVKKYADYRTFLKDWALYCQSRNSRWSYGVWARKMGLSSKSSLIMVLNGNRNPGPRMIQCLLGSLDLDEEETGHFKRIIAIQKSNLQDFFRVLVDKNGQQEADIPNRAEPRWLMLVIRELVSLHGFREDSRWLSSLLEFKVSPMEFDLAIRGLLKEGILRRDTNGALALGDATAAKTWLPHEIHRFHQDGMQASTRAYELSPPDRRAFHTSFLRIKMSRVADAKALLHKFQRDLERMLDESSGAEAVYQLNLQFFPVANSSD